MKRSYSILFSLLASKDTLSLKDHFQSCMLHPIVKTYLLNGLKTSTNPTKGLATQANWGLQEGDKRKLQSFLWSLSSLYSSFSHSLFINEIFINRFFHAATVQSTKGVEMNQQLSSAQDILQLRLRIRRYIIII